MEGPGTKTRTSERLFFLPGKAGKEIATQTVSDERGISNEDRSAVTLRERARSARSQVRATLLAVPTAFSDEISRGTLFMLLPVFAGTGAIFYFSLPAEPQLSAILSGLTVIIGCRAWAAARPMIRLVLLLAIAVVAGMLFAKLETVRVNTRMLGSEVTTRIVGRVTALTKDATGGWRLTMDVMSTTRPELHYGPDRIVISARALPRALKIGDGLAGLVRLRPQSGPMRPGNYDFAFYNFYRGIGANGFLLGKAEMVSVSADSGPTAALLMTIANIRHQLTQRILRNIKGEPGDIAASLITGQRDGISDDTNNAMRLSGLSHILSISGFHMALVAATIIGSLRAVLALFPGFSARYPVKKLAAVIALIGSAFYLLLSGSDIAAQRSFVMLGVMLLAITVDRAAISMRNLAIAALITIAISPHEILGPSFQMSYSATAALICFYGWWSKRRGKDQRQKKIHNYLWLAIVMKAANHISAIAMTSLVAGTASSIFAAYHFNNTAPFGLIGNALALPVISVFVMPFAVLGLLAMPFDLDWLPFTVMGHGIEAVIAIAKAVASHSPSGNLGMMPPATLLLVSIGLAMIFVLSTRLRLCGMPVLLAAAIFMARAQEPDIIIAEGGKLVALRTPDNRLAINRPSGSAFTLNNWQQGYGTSGLVKPFNAGTRPEETQFECKGKLCIAREQGGMVVAYTDDPGQKLAACSEGDIAILAFATGEAACSDKNVLVITQRDLALSGTAEIALHTAQRKQISTKVNISGDLTQQNVAEANTGDIPRIRTADVTYAVGPPARPWNFYRTYSRAARNLAEYTSPGRATKANAD